MSAAAFFNAARAYKRELTGEPAIGLTQEDVDALNAVTAWKPSVSPPNVEPKPPVVAKGFKFGERSIQRLQGVHPDLVKVMHRAIAASPIDFTVLEGLRSLEQQKKYMASGATRTMNSRHLTGHAVDIAPFIDGKIRWDWPLYHQIAPIVKKAAAELKIPITWGGDWRTFKDGPHWELPWKEYPK